MNRIRQKCPRQDYDFYTIKIPLKLIFKKQRRRYISSQLQKLHPCFSDDSAFDSYLYLKKDGIKADLVVMQNYKLAEYKAEKKKIFVEERKYHQFFRPGKNLIPAFISFILFLFLVFFIKSLHKENQAQLNEEIDEVLFTSATPQPHFASPELFNLLLKLNAKVEDLTWTCDGYKENLSILIKGLYPENLADFSGDLKYSSIKFEDSLPLMTLSMSNNCGQTQTDFFADYSSFKDQLRQLVFDNKITLEEESVNPYGLHLALDHKQKNNLFFIIDFLQQKKISPSLIKIRSSKNQLNLDLEFAGTYFPDQEHLYQNIKELLSLFEAPELQPRISAPPEKKENYVAAAGPSALKKIGQIIKVDGSVIIYYKDEKGKIIKR